MRVTQSMLNTQMLRNLNSNLTRLEKLQDQMSTGRAINKPSDDPVGISFALRYRSELEANEQQQKNVDSAFSWLEYTDKMVGEINQVLQRARELAVQGANSTNPDDAMKALGMEVDQLYQQLVSIGNTQFNGKYIFNGQMTDIKPYEIDAATGDVIHNINMEAIQYEVGTGTVVAVNMSGGELFGKPIDLNDPTTLNPPNAFTILKNLKDALNGSQYEDVKVELGNLDNRLNSIMEKWAEVGARTNRVELIKNRLENTNLNLQELLANVEDADMAQLMINMKTEENIYQASLSTGARVIRPSLIDFLR